MAKRPTNAGNADMCGSANAANRADSASRNASRQSGSALRRVLRQTVSRAKGLTALLVLAIAGAIAFTLVSPLVLERIVNNLAAHEGVGLALALLYFACLAAGCLFDSAREALITIFGQKITRGLRSALCEKLSKLPASYSVSTASGITTSRFVNDVDTVQALFTSGVVSMFADACTVVGILVMVFTKSLGLGVMLAVLMPLLFLFTRWVQKRTLAAQMDGRVAVGRVSNRIPESVRSIRTIRTCGAERFMERRYSKGIQDGYRAQERSNFYDSVYSPVIMITSAVVIAVMMVLAATGGAAQEFFGMSAGAAVAVIAYVGKVFGPLESIGMELQSIQSAIAGVCRIEEFLSEPERPAADGSLTAEELRRRYDHGVPALRFDDVVFGYGEAPVLHGCSFSLAPGEHATLVGRTGAGKSTAFKLLLGMYEPQGGTVEVCGAPASAIPDSQKRRLFGYVEQSFYLVPGTVAQQITLFDGSLTSEDFERAARLVGLHSHIAALPCGYDTPCDETLFSQGQWQLMSIARAVVADPPILLLDEITANLDSATERQVLDALDKASSNRTVLSISHRLFSTRGERRIQIG